MKAIKMEVLFTYDENKHHYHGVDYPIGPTAARNNFYRDSLMGNDLSLHLPGLEIGKIKVVSIKMPIPKDKNQNDKKEIQLDL